MTFLDRLKSISGKNKNALFFVVSLAVIALAIIAIVFPAELFIIERTFASAGRFIGLAFRFLIVAIILVLVVLVLKVVFQEIKKRKTNNPRTDVE